MSDKYECLAALLQVILLQVEARFRVHSEHISQELSLHFKDPEKAFASIGKDALNETLAHWAQATQLMVNLEHLEVNGERLQRFVVDTSLNFNCRLTDLHMPILRIILESDHITLKLNALNRIVLRRQEGIKPYTTTETWCTPGLIKRVVRLNLLRSKSDPFVMERMGGSRADFDNGLLGVVGGVDLIEFHYATTDENAKAGELSKGSTHKGLFSRLENKCKPGRSYGNGAVGIVSSIRSEDIRKRVR